MFAAVKVATDINKSYYSNHTTISISNNKMLIPWHSAKPPFCLFLYFNTLNKAGESNTFHFYARVDKFPMFFCEHEMRETKMVHLLS